MATGSASSGELRSLSVLFAAYDLRFQACYVRKGSAPHPGTRRGREVRELVRAGLSDALLRLDGGEVAVMQEAGFETRMDTIEAEEVAAEKLSTGRRGLNCMLRATTGSVPGTTEAMRGGVAHAR